MLSKETALGIMQDEVSMVLPSIKAIDDTTDDLEYMMVVRNLQTNQEYMHPEHVSTLSNWHCLFVDSPVMNGVDFASKEFKFPEVTTPPGYDTASLSRVFNIQGRSFKLTVTRAAPSIESCVVFYALTSSELPVNHGIFESMLETSAERKACLRQYALLALLESKGLKVETTSGELSDEITSNLQRLTLEHGTRIFQGVGTKAYHVSGWFDMPEQERTAASCSLPLILRHLCYLQFTLKGPIQYHIKAVNKYAYMVYMKNVGGLDIYYQVNMNASLAAMQNAFSQSNVPPRGFDVRMQPRSMGVLQQSFLLEIIKKQMELMGNHEGNLEEMKEEEYVKYMKYAGLDILRNEIIVASVQHSRTVDTENAMRVLESLSGRGQASKELCLTTASLVFMGIVNDVWENLVEGEENNKPFNLIKKLNKEIGSSSMVNLKNKEFLPVIIRGCQGCHPYQWWERFITQCEIRGPNKDNIKESDKSAYLCASILFHSSKYKDFFPKSMIEGEMSWDAVVDMACVSNKELGNMKEAYEILTDKASIKSEDNARKFYYVRAIAFLMLTGGGEKLKNIKTG